MSRQIQVGDIAIVTVDGREYPLSIADIHPTHIDAGNYVIVFNNGRWVIQNYPHEHNIKFRVGPSLMTDFPEIMMQILLPLDYESLINACQTNKDLDAICQDQYFWKLKVEHDYGSVTKDKPTNISYRQQYFDLVIIDNQEDAANDAAENGRLDILKWLAQRGVYPDVEIGVDLAAINGHLEVLKWLAQHNIYPDQEGVNGAAEKGYLEVLKWLAQRNLHPDQDGANDAAGAGQLDVLAWLEQQDTPIRPDEYGVIDATHGGQLEVLKWLAQRGVYPDQRVADEAAIYGHLNILKWLAQTMNINPSQVGINWAARHGQLEVLKWSAQHNIYPNQEGVNQAAVYDQSEILRWLAQTRGLHPDQESVDRAKKYKIIRGLY